MPRPPVYGTPCTPIPTGPGVARIVTGDVVVLLPAARGRVILFPVNVAREPGSRD
jgi:hypothetical protein